MPFKIRIFVSNKYATDIKKESYDDVVANDIADENRFATDGRP